MVTSLHELTKQLDALTYNSRSVLNALIRSVLSAGSSEGYQVIRGGEPVTLTRLDIYHLYNLYQEWEAKIGRESSTVDEDGVVSYGLAELVASMDADYQTENGDTSKTPYRDAAVKHAKILYMNSDNKDNTDDDWIALVDRTTNPKLVTNSAPIPINIRTPVYDENLSTKHFSEYETYLFPRGYYTLDAMGAYGDGLTHNAGGNKWLFDIDTVFQVKSPLSVFGVQENEWIKQLPSDFGDDKSYSLVVGDNCFVYGPNSFASGRWNQSIGENNAILGGVSNHVYDDESATISGIQCSVVSGTSLAGGASCDVNGGYSFAYGYNASVGGHPYPFYMGVNINDGKVVEPTTECKATITVDGCTYNRATGSNTSSNTNSGTARDLGPNEIYVKLDDIEFSGIAMNSISSGDIYKQSRLDFKVGDTVMLYRFSSNTGSLNTYPISEPINAKVTAITIHTSSSNSQTYGYIITLDKTITPTHGINATRGFVIRNTAVEHADIGSDGTKAARGLVNTSTYYSASLGIRTIAAGYAQTVVGAQNRELLRPNFIVGIGNTDYIYPAERYNGLVVAPYYNYTAVRSSYISAGMSLFTTASYKDHGLVNDSNVRDVAEYDEDPFDKYHGYYAYSTTPYGYYTGRALLRVYTKYSCLLNHDAGLEVYRSLYKSESRTAGEHDGLYGGFLATMLSGGSDGAVLISDTAGSTRDTRVLGIKSALMMTGDEYAKGSVVIDSRYSSVVDSTMLTAIRGGSYLQLIGKYLRIYADSTYNALTAQPTTVGEVTVGLNSYSKRICKLQDYYEDTLGSGWRSYREVGTGFYYTSGGTRIPSLIGDNNNPDSYHVINTSRIIAMPSGTNPARYSVSQILLPGVVSTGSAQHGDGSKLPHPVFVTTLVDTNNPDVYNNTTTSIDQSQNYICEQLAYLSDIKAYIPDTSVTVPTNIGEPAYRLYPNSGEDTEFFYDTDPNPDIPSTIVPGNGDYFVLDSYLFAITNAQNVTHAPFGLQTSTIVDPTTALTYGAKFTKLSQPLPRGAGRLTSHHESGVYLAGVMINPFMYMTLRQDTELLEGMYMPTTVGVSYLAWGNSADENPLGILRTNVATDSPYRTLHTSKFSNGNLGDTPPSDLSSIWMTVSSSSNQYYVWCKVFSSFIIAYANNKISIDFTIHPAAFKEVEGADHYILPMAKPTVASLSTPAANTLTYHEEGNQDYKYCGDDSDDYGKTMQFVIPINHLLGSHLSQVFSPTTGAFVKLWGSVAYTGDKNVYLSGQVLNANTKPGLIQGAAVPTGNNNARGTFLVLNIAGWNNDSLKGTVYEAHMEGMVNYV